jgi:hypothetical protein
MALRIVSFLISGTAPSRYYHHLGTITVSSVVQNNDFTYGYCTGRNFRHRYLTDRCQKSWLWICRTSILSQWAMSMIDDDHLCDVDIFSSRRSSAPSFTVCESSPRGRSLEEPARGSGGMEISDDRLTTLAWTPSLGDGERLLRARNGRNSDERKPCFFCRRLDIMVV